MMRHAAVILTVATTFAGAASAERYVCETDFINRFNYNSETDRWIMSDRVGGNTGYLADTDALSIKDLSTGTILFEGGDCFVHTNFMRCGETSVSASSLNITLRQLVVSKIDEVFDSGVSYIVETSYATCAELSG